MHYGHPDIMNKQYMMQQGGVSKATKTLNLSEDIFAGMDFVLRGDGREIHHCEYFHLAKGRDLGFNTVLAFFSKLASGAGEQIITRQMFRLGQVLQLPEALTFYYGHAGYYFNQFFISWSMPVLTSVWLLVLLSDCEPGFEAFQTCNSEPGRIPTPEIMAEAFSKWFSWLIFLFLLATSIPLVIELWLERSLKIAIKKLLVQLLTLSPLLFMFQAKTIGSYVVNEIRFGGATYVSTGRGLPTERRPFILYKDKKFGGLYLDYATLAYYDGVMLLALSVLVVLAGGLSEAGSWKGQLTIVFMSLGLTITSWLYAPFLFNPYMFSPMSFLADLESWCEFFFEDRGKNWISWYTEKQLKPDKGRRIGIDAALAITCLLLFTWYELLSLKVQSFTKIYGSAENTSLLKLLAFVPPIAASGVLCILLIIIEGVVQVLHRCIQHAHSLDGGATADGVDLEAATETKRVCGTMPLALVSVLVLGLDGFELAWTLKDFYSSGWTDAVIAGVVLKLLLLSTCLCWCEDLLRSHCFEKMGCFGLPVQLWVHSHRMSRDLITSTLILSALTPLVILNVLNNCLTPGCSIHQLLIFRDHKPPARQALNIERREVRRLPFGISFWKSEKTSASDRTQRNSMHGSEQTFRSERTVWGSERTPGFNPLAVRTYGSPSDESPSDGQFTFGASVSDSRVSGSEKASEVLSSEPMSISQEQSEQSSSVNVVPTALEDTPDLEAQSRSSGSSETNTKAQSRSSGSSDTNAKGLAAVTFHLGEPGDQAQNVRTLRGSTSSSGGRRLPLAKAKSHHVIKKMTRLPSIMSAAQESGELSSKLPKSALLIPSAPHASPRAPLSARSVNIDLMPEMVRYTASPDISDSDDEDIVMDIGESCARQISRCPSSKSGESDEEHILDIGERPANSLSQGPADSPSGSGAAPK